MCPAVSLVVCYVYCKCKLHCNNEPNRNGIHDSRHVVSISSPILKIMNHVENSKYKKEANHYETDECCICLQNFTESQEISCLKQ